MKSLEDLVDIVSANESAPIAAIDGQEDGWPALGNNGKKSPWLVEEYAHRIRKVWGRSAEAMLEVSAVVAEARARLDFPGFGKLATELGASRGTLSKLVSIHSRRERFEGRLETVPAAWTVAYKLSKLDDEQFESLAASGRLKPNLSEKEISQFTAQHAGVATPAVADQQVCLPFQIVAPALLSLEGEDDIKKKVIDAINGVPNVFVRFSGRRKVKTARK